NPDLQSDLEQLAVGLQAQGQAGNPIRQENFHLTLIFLGEVNVQPALRALRLLHVAPFTICCGDIGRFNQKEGDLYWLGIRENRSLQDLYRKLAAGLHQEGLPFEDRCYQPHITLVRQLKLRTELVRIPLQNSLQEQTIAVTHISLMCSDRIDGQLSYRAVERLLLKG
ncbi:MAG TPA: RNA 2',3'-cyclic phosphodiesterase, partial [Bacillota bacterium]|nr:RNA 2',3'-cyclic phosphodiesterase [Bacillota bacterium]